MEEKKKKTCSYLCDYAKPFKELYYGSLCLAILGVVCSIVPYFAIAKIVLKLMVGEHVLKSYLMWILVIIVFSILRVIFHSLSTTISHKATFAVITEVRQRLTKKLVRLPMGEMLSTPSGVFKNIIVEKVDSIEPTLAHVLPEMTSNLLMPVGIFIYLAILDWRMALASLVTLPIGFVCYFGMMKDFEIKYKNYIEKNKHLNGTVVEYINGIEVIKAFNQSASSYQKFTTATKEAANSAIYWMKSTQGYFAAAMSVFPAVLLGVLPFGCIFYMNGTLASSTFIMIIILSLGIMPPLLTALSYTDDLAKIGTVVGDISEILNKPELIRPKESIVLDNYEIRIENVSFQYGETQVINNINLEIETGKVTAFVGPSGGGKSTIAKLIASLWDVTSGEILIGGENIKDISLEQLNKTIAYVAQDNYLFNDTIRNNIRMGNVQASDERVEEVAKASGCHEFIMNLEKGYETMAGCSGGHLSGGESQRIAIARAMLKDADIIILDEATAYTDPENEAVIQNAVAKLVEGKTLIVIAHRLATISDADKIVVIEKGKIVKEGTHEYVLANCDLYHEMWDAYKDYKEEKGEMAV